MQHNQQLYTKTGKTPGFFLKVTSLSHWWSFWLGGWLRGTWRLVKGKKPSQLMQICLYKMYFVIYMKIYSVTVQNATMENWAGRGGGGGWAAMALVAAYLPGKHSRNDMIWSSFLSQASPFLTREILLDGNEFCLFWMPGLCSGCERKLRWVITWNWRHISVPESARSTEGCYLYHSFKSFLFSL